MKKIILILLNVILTFQIYAQKNNEPYNYPIKLGSLEWNSFKSVEDMYNACQIPTNILNNLSTKALIKTCLDYPASAVLFIHNTPQQGFNTWKLRFNGIKELLLRLDAPEELINVYNTIDIKGRTKLKNDLEKGKYIFMFQMLEEIIAQDDIISKLNQGQQKKLLKKCLSNYQLVEVDNEYGFTNLESTGRIILQLAFRLGDPNLNIKIQSKEIQDFIRTGFLQEREIFLQLIKDTKKLDTLN